MKIEKNKHNHSLTSLLKTAIFAMLMIAPLFASCSQLIYVTFNKNAYQSTQITGKEYYTTYEYETNEVNSVDDLVIGNIYHYIRPTNTITEDLTTYFCNADMLKISFTNIEVKATATSTDFFTFRRNTNNTYYIYGQGSYTATFFNLPSSQVGETLDFYFVPHNLTYINEINIEFISASHYLGEKTVNERPIQALDNAFYYGVEKMTESPLFNWTQNTALYTGIKTMTDNLQVQTNVIAVLVTYWTILTIIYIIIDIVLGLFTKMTHILVRSD